MQVFFVRHQQRGVLHDSPYATREEAEKAAEQICIAEKDRPAWLKPESEWWCARVYDAPDAPPAAAVSGEGGPPRLTLRGTGRVLNPRE